jgi:hypothetical protein
MPFRPLTLIDALLKTALRDNETASRVHKNTQILQGGSLATARLVGDEFNICGEFGS